MVLLMAKYIKKTKKCKTGPRSNQETELLHKYMAEGKTPKYISEKLNRNEDKINDWIEELHINSIKGADPYRVKRILDSLKSSHFWGEITQQFTPDEIRYFEGEWASLMHQFGEDIAPAELLMVKQLITINILINRSMKERKKHIEEIDKVQSAINKEYDKPADKRDIDMLSQLEQQISFAKSSITQYTTEYTKLLSEQKNINRDLKVTRDQRIKRLEDSKTSFSGWLKALEDEKYRERVGYESEIMRIAANKSQDELGEYYTYADNKLDRPLLTPETVMRDEER